MIGSKGQSTESPIRTVLQPIISMMGAPTLKPLDRLVTHRPENIITQTGCYIRYRT